MAINTNEICEMMKTVFGQFVYANWSDIHACFFIHHPQFVLISKETHFVLYRKHNVSYKMYLRFIINLIVCSTVHFCRIASVYQPTNTHIISYNTL